jgi:hypothetical protein
VGLALKKDKDLGHGNWNKQEKEKEKKKLKKVYRNSVEPTGFNIFHF